MEGGGEAGSNGEVQSQPVVGTAREDVDSGSGQRDGGGDAVLKAPAEVHANGDGAGVDQDKAAGAMSDAAAAANPVATPTASTIPAAAPTLSPSLANATTAKKFNSLSVAKQFFQKASPTLSSASAAAANASPSSTTPGKSAAIASLSGLGGMASSSSRLSTSMPASRLATVKLSGAKPSSPGWAQISTPAGQANVSTASIGGGGGQNDPGSAASSAGGAGVASPRLVTALARSTSPHVRSGEGSKGSPGLRNAALSGLGRSTSPSTASLSGTAGAATSSRAPWAALKTGTMNTAQDSTSRSRGMPRPSEFPTAAEAAQAKAEAERREKAAAVEAAAKADQALQKLESFRGTSLGEGFQWDEMDDDLDEVMDFGGGVVSTANDEPVTKEERFKDVGHDRSWPQRAGDARSSGGQKKVSGTGGGGNDATSQARLYPGVAKPRVETMALRSGEGVSLDALPSERGPAINNHPSRESRPSAGAARRAEADEGARHGGHHSAAPSNAARGVIATAPAPSARAWGPLAQRQASLNPNAPKPAVVETPAKAKAVDEAEHARAPPNQARVEVADKPKPASVKSSVSPVKSAPTQAAAPREGRALPPHLAVAAAAKAQAAEEAQEVTKGSEPEVVGTGSTARPYGSLVGSAKTTPAPASAPASEPKQTPVPAVDQRDEMLSAAERARKRRQAEEDERQKERERALAKAQAIEAKMREEQERVKREEQERRAEAQKARRATSTVDTSQGKGSGADSVTSPQSAVDEAKSWRRSADTAHAKSVANGEAGTPKVLLRRPSGSEMEAKEAGGKGQPSGVAIPTGPRATREHRGTVEQGQGGAPGAAPSKPERKARGNRVEIIAPTDAGAGKHSQQQQRQRGRDAGLDRAQAPLVGVLKPTAQVNKPTQAAVVVAREEETTRKEVGFDSAPVWNRFVVRLGVSQKPRVRLRAEEFKAQKARMVQSQKDENEASKVNILSWEPPIAALSMRTLSRDDQFFSKKYRKGVVISNVLLPRNSVESFAEQRAVAREREVRKQAARSAALAREVEIRTLEEPVSELERAFSSATLSSSAPSVKVPMASSNERSAASSAMAGLSSLPAHPHRGADGMMRNDFDASDPSRLLKDNGHRPVVSLRPTGGQTAGQQSLRPSHGLSSATWGESSLTFAGLEPSSGRERSAAAFDERNRIKDVWSSSNQSARTAQKPTQNSLEGIVDDFPSTMSMMHALNSDLADEMARTNGSKMTGSREGATAGADTGGIANNRAYPMAAANSTTPDRNIALTAASSPIVNGSPLVGADGHEQPGAVARVRSQSPSSSMRPYRGAAHVNDLGGGGGAQTFIQRDRTGVRSAFGPYAYPDAYGMQSDAGSQQQYQSAYRGDGYGGFDSSYNPNPSHRQAQYAGGAGSNYNGTQNRYRNSGGGGAGALNGMGGYNSVMHGGGGGGYEDMGIGGFAGTGENVGGGMGYDASGNGFIDERNAGGAYDADFSAAAMQNGAGTAAGWPLDSPVGGGGAMAMAYGSPNHYYVSAAGYQGYVPQQHRQQRTPQQQYVQNRPGYHGRSSSSGYRGYNSSVAGQYPRQMAAHGGGAGSYYGMYAGAEAGAGYPGQAAAAAAGMHHHSSSLQATAKPFQAGKAGVAPREDRAAVAGESTEAEVDEQQAQGGGQDAQQYAGYNAAVW